jgi:DNA replication and repair protein RecF
MRVTSVQLRDFRTYSRAEASFGEGLTVVHGPNGAGKSNLLEAIYFGCTGHSPRTRNERELIRFGAQVARVVVQLSDAGQPHELTVGFGAFDEGQRLVKRMQLDGAHVERMLDVECRPLVSLFLPDRLELLRGPPALRRAHLDRLIAALWPPRVATRRSYQSALSQRNALLGRVRAGAATPQSINAWDLELSTHGLALREDRAQATELLRAPFTERCTQLGLGERTHIEYRPRTKATDPEQLREELESRLANDLERGFTTHGPHRDELAVMREGRELRTYGSQGERRLALLALLLAERAVLTAERHRTPLMLLDDVMSELDCRRRELLSDELSASPGQSVVASTDLDHVPGALASSAARLRVSAGTVLEEALAA